MRTLAQLKEKQLDALKVRAGIDGVLVDLPLQVGQHVTGPIIDHRGIHHGFPGVGEIISVERQKSRFDSKTRFYVKLKVSLPF